MDKAFEMLGSEWQAKSFRTTPRNFERVSIYLADDLADFSGRFGRIVVHVWALRVSYRFLD